MLNSTHIGQVEKAHRYAQEPERVTFQRLTVTSHGENSEHHVSWDGQAWHSDSAAFAHYGICAHVMALQRILAPMLPPAARLDESEQGHSVPYSTLIAKVEKAKRYAEEPQRFHFDDLTATFHGENADHEVCWDGTNWDCDSPTFRRDGMSAHIMALQQMLGPMLPTAAHAYGLAPETELAPA